MLRRFSEPFSSTRAAKRFATQPPRCAHREPLTSEKIKGRSQRSSSTPTTEEVDSVQTCLNLPCCYCVHVRPAAVDARGGSLGPALLAQGRSGFENRDQSGGQGGGGRERVSRGAGVSVRGARGAAAEALAAEGEDRGAAVCPTLTRALPLVDRVEVFNADGGPKPLEETVFKVRQPDKNDKGAFACYGRRKCSKGGSLYSRTVSPPFRANNTYLSVME